MLALPGSEPLSPTKSEKRFYDQCRGRNLSWQEEAFFEGAISNGIA
jgi:hypothetical protein